MHVKGYNLGKQSADEGKPSNETGLDSEAHSTAVVSTTTAPSGGGGRRTATVMNWSARERFSNKTQLTWMTTRWKK